MSARQRALVFGALYSLGLLALGEFVGHRWWIEAAICAVTLVSAVVLWAAGLIAERLDEQAATREGARFTGERY